MTGALAVRPAPYTALAIMVSVLVPTLIAVLPTSLINASRFPTELPPWSTRSPRASSCRVTTEVTVSAVEVQCVPTLGAEETGVPPSRMASSRQRQTTSGFSVAMVSVVPVPSLVVQWCSTVAITLTNR